MWTGILKAKAVRTKHRKNTKERTCIFTYGFCGGKATLNMCIMTQRQNLHCVSVS